MKVVAPVVFKYLALPNGLGGRGGAQRFFLLANQIPFTEDLVPMDQWAEEKQRIITSGENPCGSLPVVYTTHNNEGKFEETLSQHIASSRYLARIHHVTTDNTAYDEYVQDLVADEYQGFRDNWAKVAFSGTDEEKADYKENVIPKYLAKFESLYAKFKTEDAYLSTSMAGNPLWGDAAVFGLLRDNVITGLLDMDTLESSSPHLWKMYESFGTITSVKKWIEAKN